MSQCKGNKLREFGIQRHWAEQDNRYNGKWLSTNSAKKNAHLMYIIRNSRALIIGAIWKEISEKPKIPRIIYSC